jgi:hypothetical protein
LRNKDIFRKRNERDLGVRYNPRTRRWETTELLKKEDEEKKKEESK